MVSANFLGFAGDDDIQVFAALLQLAQRNSLAAPLLTGIGPRHCSACRVSNLLCLQFVALLACCVFNLLLCYVSICCNLLAFLLDT